MTSETGRTEVTATELARSLSDILNRVRYRGERFVVKRNGEPMAVIEPFAAPKVRTGREVAALLRGLRMPEGFGDDLEAIHAAQGMSQTREWPD